jgi:hypothetical protein
MRAHGIDQMRAGQQLIGTAGGGLDLNALHPMAGAIRLQLSSHNLWQGFVVTCAISAVW